MQDKLQELTDRLYNEGLSKGKHDGEELVQKAQAEADRIIAYAKAEAEHIIAQANKAYRSMPRLLPNAFARHSPSASAVSSIVWCSSTFRSPFVRIVRSMPP